jgi:four helix bundle protein
MYKSFQDMSVWNRAMEWSEEVFHLTAPLPKSEDYGLTSQLRRSANSITANIAEGFGRKTNKDKAHFYVISRGSAYETQSHLLYGVKVNYFEEQKVSELCDKYSELIYELNKIIKSINAQPQP